MGETVRQAIKAGDLAALAPERLEELSVDVNECLGSEGYTTLHWACHYGRAEVLEHLLNLGADVSLTTGRGWTAAHICALRGCTECLKALCKEGIDLEAVDNRGYTSAHLAAIHGKCSVLQWIIGEGVDVSVADGRGWSVVHHAAFHGRLAILQLLNELEIDLLAEDRDGNTPAHLSASEGYLDCLRLLVETAPKKVIECRNTEGSTARDLALKFLKHDCAEFLGSLEGRDLHSTQPPSNLLNHDSKEYPAHSAASHGDLRLLSMAVEEGKCQVNDKDPSGATPAHAAAEAGKTVCLQWLVDHGADTSLRNNASETPLDLAVKSSQVECIAILSNEDRTPGEGDDISRPGLEASSETIATAGEKVEQLEKLLAVARARYQELGGVLREEQRAGEWRGVVEELSLQLEAERERREELEVELDCLHQQLHESVGQTSHYHSLLMAQGGSLNGRRSSSTYDSIHRQVEPFQTIPGICNRRCQSASAAYDSEGVRGWRGKVGSSGYRPQQAHKRQSPAGMFVRVDHV